MISTGMMGLPFTTIFCTSSARYSSVNYGNITGSHDSITGGHGNITGGHINITGSHGNIAGGHDNFTGSHGHIIGSHGNNEQSICSTPQHSHHGDTQSSSSLHGYTDKHVPSDESLQVTDSFELSCQKHHEALERLLNTATAGGLLSSDDDLVPNNSGSFVVRGRSLAHKRPPPGRTHRSRDHKAQQQTTRRVKKPEK